MLAQDSVESNGPCRTKIRFYSNRKLYYFLTNFFPSPIAYFGHQFATAEAFFQAAKFDAHEKIQRRISRTEWPRFAFEQAQLHSRLVSGIWPQQRLEVMEIAQLLKYTQNPNLQQRLLQTGDAELIEDSKSDSFWGIGHGSGANHLGRILMEIRGRLRYLTVPMTGILGYSQTDSLLWSSKTRQLRVQPGLHTAPAAAHIFLHGMSFDELSHTIHGLVQTKKRVQHSPQVHARGAWIDTECVYCTPLPATGDDHPSFYEFTFKLRRDTLDPGTSLIFVLSLGDHTRTRRIRVTAS
ncbi:hypothetical protein CF319_g5168 [Tilletia indica]|uniref:Uncharacterized protein n=1 Tax=Tilletia indica TaxID=43049 RepID=A0A177TLZ1_9BASI|nr:hypothetical protein CF319_g5168 [Tilletia indica]KAE8250507.1 hypothetical protein A4X13_0g4664 [Tilletia indica]